MGFNKQNQIRMMGKWYASNRLLSLLKTVQFWNIIRFIVNKFISLEIYLSKPFQDKLVETSYPSFEKILDSCIEIPTVVLITHIIPLPVAVLY